MNYQSRYKLHKFLAKNWERTHPKIGKECILCNISFNFFYYNANNPVHVNEQTCQRGSINWTWTLRIHMHKWQRSSRSQLAWRKDNTCVFSTIGFTYQTIATSRGRPSPNIEWQPVNCWTSTGTVNKTSIEMKRLSGGLCCLWHWWS